MQLVDCDVLQVHHLQHVGSEERALQCVHVTCVNSASVNVAQNDREYVRGNTMKIYSLISDQRLAQIQRKARLVNIGV